MSKRTEIIDGKLASVARYGLVYSEVLGWMNLGHAQGSDVIRLWSKLNAGESSREPTYDVTYSQSMADGKTGLRLGKFITCESRRGGHIMNDNLSRLP